ncbi:BOLA class I histocompatibility antigen, alpha chain BL3-7-like isoform X2 [Dromiciops gliroides]|uniref:BOLA class I histocompatibility antigen, alpha chain BL3-7-like isoform X2 n=1 Tax=Dromiciops gliroides TaxID=33562 RepID=UPI001CC52BEE|nr:BOLA class I histocompatibility antigen, alpha chain BL3-7-like isoform X2 [Dromiciops gliroides]
MQPFLLSFLLAAVVRSDPKARFHSLRYFQTSMTLPGLQEPRFISVGYVDDQQFVRFDSHSSSQREEHLAPWVDKIGQDHEERNSRIVRETAHTFQVGLQNLQAYYNRSEGVHTYQRLVGCEASSDGTFRRGFEQFAYDGHDYISLDPETLSWTAADTAAENSKRKWEAERSIAQRQKVYLQQNCVEWLKKYLEYGKETLQRAGPSKGPGGRRIKTVEDPGEGRKRTQGIQRDKSCFRSNLAPVQFVHDLAWAAGKNRQYCCLRESNHFLTKYEAVHLARPNDQALVPFITIGASLEVGSSTSLPLLLSLCLIFPSPKGISDPGIPQLRCACSWSPPVYKQRRGGAKHLFFPVKWGHLYFFVSLSVSGAVSGFIGDLRCTGYPGQGLVFLLKCPVLFWCPHCGP